MLGHLLGQGLEVESRDHERVEGCCEVRVTGSLRGVSVYAGPGPGVGWTVRTTMIFLDLLGVVEESGWTLYAGVE